MIRCSSPIKLLSFHIAPEIMTLMLFSIYKKCLRSMRESGIIPRNFSPNDILVRQLSKSCFLIREWISMLLVFIFSILFVREERFRVFFMLLLIFISIIMLSFFFNFGSMPYFNFINHTFRRWSLLIKNILLRLVKNIDL